MPNLVNQKSTAASQQSIPLPAKSLLFDFSSGSCTLEEVEKNLLEQALDHTDGNISMVARLLGLTRGALRHKLEKRGLSSS
jgi:DNA-binding NtrC family response regulator